MTVARLLKAWLSDPEVAACIQVKREIPACAAQTVPFPDSLHPALINALRMHGIQNLYSHQAASLEQAQSGQNIMIVTGVASGKTLCYNLPVLDCLLHDPDSRALYLFPTKALAQDQAAALRDLLQHLSVSSDALIIQSLAIYDGDTPAHIRPAIRNKARLLFSNPDMLHIGLLPHHTSWAEFFRKLRFVIIDEAHVYRGIFGSHVSNVLRRLRRIARFYGAEPQFILTSATIANPVELAIGLIGSATILIDQDGASRGSKSFLIYNPPIINPDLGLRRSALQESVHLVHDLLANQVQTIIFGRSRRTVELILSYLRQSPLGSLPSASPFTIPGTPEQPLSTETIQLVCGYRSGYLPERRREIERGLRQGNIRAVVATNALELGIDIGGIEAVLLVGYPGTIAAARQQAGRAGRGSNASIAILVATADPIDQFLTSHPEYLFERSPEHALINSDNPLILLDHLRCAAFEMPFQRGEAYGSVDPETLVEYLAFLEDEGVLHQSGDKYFWMADQYPAQSISLRSASANPILLIALEDDYLPENDFNAQSTQARRHIIGQVDRASAHWMIHPNAIYLHEAETFRVEDLDIEKGFAHLRRVESDYYTLPRRETNVILVQLHDLQSSTGAIHAHGEIQVTTRVTGYRKVKWFTHENLGGEELHLPPVDLLTNGYWVALSEETVNKLKESGLWRNEQNDYGPNWEAQRSRARQRDQFRCQVCFTLEGERAYPVHHKIPFRIFPSFVQANMLDNLVTLCPDCHRRVETVVRVRSGLAGLAFVFGNLAPFFLMCDPRDLGAHSDPQSPLADGFPAVVVYEQIPAGIGFSERLFELHSELLRRALDLVSACPCSDGCPSCVGPGGEQGAGGKAETFAILTCLNPGLE